MADLAPVRCNHCRQVYDLCDGKPVARYADCTVYITPCCGRQVDDRGEGWTSQVAFTRLSPLEAATHEAGYPYVDEYGRVHG